MKYLFLFVSALVITCPVIGQAYYWDTLNEVPVDSLDQIASSGTSEQYDDYGFSFDKSEPNWIIDMLHAGEPRTMNYQQAPQIMMAGYIDSDITYDDGGTFRMLAYVVESGSPVESVEIYWESEPTGAYLYDDGNHDDFGAGDGLWGLFVEVEPETVPGGEYLLELRAYAFNGQSSDLWPYLTIHP